MHATASCAPAEEGGEAEGRVVAASWARPEARGSNARMQHRPPCRAVCRKLVPSRVIEMIVMVMAMVKNSVYTVPGYGYGYG